MKVYKLTLQVSLYLLLALVVLSVILNCWSESKWIEFILNWCVGIACSTSVVIVTTLIQFKFEQRKSISELASYVRQMLFHNFMYGDAFSDGNDFEQHNKEEIKHAWLRHLNEDITQLNIKAFNIEFLRKNDALTAVAKAGVLTKLYLSDGTNIEDKYFSCQESLNKIGESILQFDINNYDREEIENYLLTFR